MRNNLIHILVILVIGTTQFFIKDLEFGYYRWHTRPKLIEQGFRSCVGYHPNLADYKPKDCDLVKVSRSQDRIDEWYIIYGGVQAIHVASLDGPDSHASPRQHANQSEWTSSVDSFSNWILAAAFLMVIFSMMHRMARTGKFAPFLLLGEPYDRTEAILYVYGFAIFISRILCGLVGR
jgi:hypothetical protein